MIEQDKLAKINEKTIEFYVDKNINVYDTLRNISIIKRGLDWFATGRFGLDMLLDNDLSKVDVYSVYVPEFEEKSWISFLSEHRYQRIDENSNKMTSLSVIVTNDYNTLLKSFVDYRRKNMHSKFDIKLRSTRYLLRVLSDISEGDYLNEVLNKLDEIKLNHDKTNDANEERLYEKAINTLRNEILNKSNIKRIDNYSDSLGFREKMKNISSSDYQKKVEQFIKHNFCSINGINKKKPELISINKLRYDLKFYAPRYRNEAMEGFVNDFEEFFYKLFKD
ncbi:MAG: hypothetical protein GWP09_01005 [Nitrospiraceae bacterium]|nr:hypothetical protein [Nitrospiraceae bacterium]